MSALSRIVWTFIAALLVAMIVRDVRFYFDKKIVQVDAVAAVQKLRDNMMAEISLNLDMDRALTVKYLSQREFLLVPFSGTGYRLMYVIEAPLTENYMATLRPPFKGRVVEKDFGESYEMFNQRMDLRRIFNRDGIELPADAMLVYDAPKAPPNLWICFICTVAIGYIIYQSYSLTNFLLTRKRNSRAVLRETAIRV